MDCFSLCTSEVILLELYKESLKSIDFIQSAFSSFFFAPMVRKFRMSHSIHSVIISLIYVFVYLNTFNRDFWFNYSFFVCICFLFVFVFCFFLSLFIKYAFICIYSHCFIVFGEVGRGKNYIYIYLSHWLFYSLPILQSDFEFFFKDSYMIY